VPTSIVAPASSIEQKVYLAGLKTSTPEDYRRILAMADGFVVGDWRFSGTGARLLTLPAMTYIIAAEPDDSTLALCFRKDRVHRAWCSSTSLTHWNSQSTRGF
jgi:hypothetical protein